MANYPKELTDLLEQYLTDGILTAKERAVLLRKAEALGINTDEFDLYIDAEEQKIDQKIDAAKRQAKGKLCPFCEAQVPMLAEKCPECGGIITAEASSAAEEIINALEDALVNFKSGKDVKKSKADVERYARKIELYYTENKKIQKLLSEVKKELVVAEKKLNWKSILAKRIAIAVAALAGCALLGYAAIWLFGYDEEDLCNDVRAALEENNVSKAEALIHDFGKDENKEYNYAATKILAEHLFKTENLEGILKLDFYFINNNNSYRKKLIKIIVDQTENHEEAWAVGTGILLYNEDERELFFTILDKMEKTSDKAALKRFIDRHYSEFPKVETIKNKNYYYLNVKADAYKQFGIEE